MSYPQVRQERTGWRDQKISERHRMWGYNCPAVDLDFLVVEYNVGKPVGLVEYKHEGAAMPNFNHPTYRALSELANAANLPFLIAFYNNTQWWFKVFPVNTRAKAIFTSSETLSEKEYVTALYKMRSRIIELAVLNKLNTAKPTPPVPPTPATSVPVVVEKQPTPAQDKPSDKAA